MSVLSAVQDYIKTFSEIESSAPVWVNYLGDEPGDYGIYPGPGGGTIEEYINGSTIEEFNFSFQSSESTADDLERIDTIGFYEDFREWLKAQTKAENFPVLEAGKTPYVIEALGWGFLFEEGAKTGVYSIQCRLEYHEIG